VVRTSVTSEDARFAATPPDGGARIGKTDGGSSRKPRVVYFIASHVHPEQIVRMVRACRSGSRESRVLLHHDYNVSHLDPKLVEDVGNVDVIPADGAVGWGSFGTCALILRCMRWLMDHHEFDWVCHLSGQDYPIRPLADIEGDLARATHDGYMLSFPLDALQWDVGPARYLYRYHEVPKFKGWHTLRHWVHKHQTKRLAAGKLPFASVAPMEGFRLGVRAFHGPFRNGFECYKGSSWWTLNRRSVEYMVRYADSHPALVKHYRRVGFAPNESFFPTILRNNSSLNLITNDHKRFIRWSHPETGHPDLLTSDDLPAMLASGKDFARKIDSRKDSRILDLLDEHLGIPALVSAAS
jgi:hypothetical protein